MNDFQLNLLLFQQNIGALYPSQKMCLLHMFAYFVSSLKLYVSVSVLKSGQTRHITVDQRKTLSHIVNIKSNEMIIPCLYHAGIYYVFSIYLDFLLKKNDIY